MDWDGSRLLRSVCLCVWVCVLNPTTNRSTWEERPPAWFLQSTKPLSASNICSLSRYDTRSRRTSGVRLFLWHNLQEWKTKHGHCAAARCVNATLGERLRRAVEALVWGGPIRRGARRRDPLWLVSKRIISRKSLASLPREIHCSRV